jgi:outer membrane lipoprotein-sorting protein
MKQLERELGAGKMFATERCAKTALWLTLCGILLAGTSGAQTAESVLQKSRDAYNQMKSYADTGVVVQEYGPSLADKHTFSTAFNRSPRHVLLDFHKQGGDQFVIWADPDAFHTWWKSTGQQYDYPNPNNIPAISMSGQTTSEVALKIPTLLYGKVLGAAMLDLHDPELDGNEDIGGHKCYRTIGRASDSYAKTGKEVNVRKATVWVDSDSFLVRKMVEEWKAQPGQVNRKTTTFEPRANPTLDDSQFKFSPPKE